MSCFPKHPEPKTGQQEKRKRLFLSFCWCHRMKWPIFSLRHRAGGRGRSGRRFPLSMHHWDPFIAEEPNPEMLLLSKSLISALSLERSCRCTWFTGHQRSGFAISELSGFVGKGQVGFSLLGAGTIEPDCAFGAVSAVAPFRTKSNSSGRLQKRQGFHWGLRPLNWSFLTNAVIFAERPGR